MMNQIIQYVIISLVLIVLIHYFFTFLKTNLTVPKVKDMVNIPSKCYKDIIDSIDNKKQNDNASNKMKDELKQYMASLVSNKTDTLTNNNNQTTISNHKIDNISSISYENLQTNSKLDFSYSDF